MVKVRGQELEVDILEELQEFAWTQEVIRGNKFIACSPFRSDRHPSFAVNLETGTFIDSGNDDEYYHKGSLIKLLSILRQEDEEMTESYLLEKYSLILDDTTALILHIELYSENDKPRYFSKEELKHLYVYSSDYLRGRGISQEVQDIFGIGYDAQHNAVAIPWTDSRGQIINVKYRRLDSKSFFYEKEGQLTGKFVFGLYLCKLHKADTIFICESETDAMTLWTYGYYAVAVGGSSLSEQQKTQILNCGFSEIIIATDNDKVGERFAIFLQEEFAGHTEVSRIKFPTNKKDINELTDIELHKAVLNRVNYIPQFLQPLQ